MRSARSLGLRGVCAGVWLIAAACGGSASSKAPATAHEPASRSEPASDLERAILAALPGLPAADAEVEVEGRAVLAGAPYDAASGRTCRSVRVLEAEPGVEAAQLACHEQEGPWFFVPGVYPQREENRAKR